MSSQGEARFQRGGSVGAELAPASGRDARCIVRTVYRRRKRRDHVSSQLTRSSTVENTLKDFRRQSLLKLRHI